MSFVGLLDGLQDALVYPEADGYGEEGEAHVGADADDAAHSQGQEQKEAGAKNHACGLDITPVQELDHCTERKGVQRQTTAGKGGVKLGWTMEVMWKRDDEIRMNQMENLRRNPMTNHQYRF